jgi:uncharacterized membrane protein YedE/YeeE
MSLLLSLVTGALFGLGLALAGMLNPTKVVAFLDITGNWDPSLAFVMGAGLVVNLIGWQIAKRRTQPIFASQFHLPQASQIDRRLLVGSALFGVGWGLAGLCPGPAITSLAFMDSDAVIFFVAMAAGLLASRRIFVKR